MALSRREVMVRAGAGLLLAGTGTGPRAQDASTAPPATAPPVTAPTTKRARPPALEADRVREFVGAAHGNLTRVREMLTEQPALVTLDMQMPNLSGRDVLLGIRADERSRRVKVILITANVRASATEELVDLADIILIKPVTLSQISEMAARLVPMS